VLSVAVINSGWLSSRCTLETNYFCIKVEEEMRAGKPVRVLILDRLVHSFTSLDDPTTLVYSYEQMYAEVTAYLAERNDQLSALFIGGGGYTFPRHMEATYPDSQLEVIEIDPGVSHVAHELLGLSRDTDIVTYNEDARVFMRDEPTTQFDLILGDAFNDFSVPYHLTTYEFNERVKAWLDDDGLYVVNIIDGRGGGFLRAYVHTMQQTFQHVYVAPTVENWRQVGRSTFVIVGTDTPLELDALRASPQIGGVSQFLRHVLTKQQLSALLEEGETILLTDQYAPVDQMLASLFRNQARSAVSDEQ
jgi:spermidine synthase